MEAGWAHRVDQSHLDIFVEAAGKREVTGCSGAETRLVLGTQAGHGEHVLARCRLEVGAESNSSSSFSTDAFLPLRAVGASVLIVVLRWISNGK